MSGLREENIRVRIQAISDLPEVRDQLNELIRLQKQQAELSQQAALSARTGSIQQVNAIEGVTAALKEQQNQQKKSNDDTTDGLKKAGQGYEDLGKTVRNFATLVAGAFTLNEIKNFGLDVIDAKTKIDQLKISLDVMLGSKKESADLYAQIVTLAKQTPFSLEEVAENVVKLKAYNIATSELIPTINALGNIAAAVGKDKLPQLTLAYGQVQNFGKLMGAELRQFTEAGVPLFDLLASSMGKTREEVIKLTTEHKIMAVDVKKAIMDASETGGKYYQLMALQAKTLGGEVSNLGDSFFVAKGRIGDFFEGQLKGGIRTMTDLMNATVGSNSAIQRTLDIVKAVASLMITYASATTGARIASTLLTAAETAKNVVYGAYLLLMQRLTQQQIIYTAAQTEAMVAARGFGAVLAANPIGAVVAAVGALVTAYYAYKAVTDEVISALGEEEIKLKTSQTELNGLTKAAMSAAEGTKERKDAIALLVQKYPEYFAGINTEKVTNSELKGILDKVNASYKTRISLARQAYQLEGLADKQKELLEFEKNFFDGLPKDIGQKFNNDITKFNEALATGGVASAKLKEQLNDFAPGGAEFFGGVAKNANEKFKEVEKAYADVNTTMQKSDTMRIEAAKAAEDARWQVQLSTLKKGTAEYKTAEQEHLDSLAKINGTFKEAEIKAIDEQGKKKVEKAKLSAAELSALLKDADADSLKDRLAALDAEEKVEQAAANKAAKNKEDARIRILAIDAEYDQKRALMIEADRRLFSANVQDQINTATDGTGKLVALDTIVWESAKDKNKRIAEFEKETAKLKIDIAENDAQRSNSQRLTDLLATADTASKKRDLLIELGKKTGDELAVLEVQRLKDVRDSEALKLEIIKANQGEESKTYQDKYVKFLEAEKEYGDKSEQLTKQLQEKLIQIYAEEVRRKKQLQDEAINLLVQGLQAFNQQTLALRDAAVQGFSAQMQAELTAHADNYAKREQIINDYTAKEQEALYSANALSRVTSFLSSALTAFQDYSNQKSRVDQDYSLKVQEIETQKNLGILSQTQATNEAIKASEAQKQQTIAAGISAGASFLGSIIQTNLQLEIQAAEAEKAIAKEKHAAKIALLDDQFAKQKADLDAATQANLDAATQQFNDAKTALEQQLADRLSQLQTARDTEKADTTAHYEALISAAAGNADEQERLKQELTAKLTAIDTQYNADVLASKEANEKAKTDLSRNYTDQQVVIKKEGTDKEKELQQALTTAKAQADTDYNNKVRELNKNQFNAQRDMAKASIAISLIQGAAALFAINPILGIIGAFAAIGAGAYLFDKLNSIPNPYDGSTSGGGNLGGINGDGAVAYDAQGKPIYGFDANGNPLYKAPDGSLVAVDNEPQIKKQWRSKKEQLSEDEDLAGKLELYKRELSAAAPGSEYYNEVKGKITEIETRHPDLASEIARIKQEIADYEKEMTKQGIKFFLGTHYVEGAGYPDGRDTVPAMVNKGERILTTDDNLSIGGRGLTNEQLVAKIKFFDKLAADFPHLVTGYDSMPVLKLPDGIMNSAGGTVLDVSGLRDDLRAVKQAVENKKLLALNVDANGFSTALIGQQSTQTYYSNLHQQ